MNVDDVFALLGQPIQIRVVQDRYGMCPRCGAYWGHPDPALDFPNRQKVDSYWRCYNPECTCGYYDPETGDIEEQASPEEQAAAAERAHAEVEEMMRGKKWETVDLGNGVTESRLVPVEEGDEAEPIRAARRAQVAEKLANQRVFDRQREPRQSAAVRTRKG